MSNCESPPTPPQSTKVVEAVAAELGVDPTTLEIPLTEVVDPDALDTLFNGQDRSGEVRFSYYGYRVVVQADGEISLRETQ
ncbi:HalOD1 output domain-containing protein [Haloparvum sedimenti]|uniref:HalOD1 output domain-containing protein n=1 Tax=Haloparvum sedimenti TaxID=1678448 RepID=UPI0009B5D2C5|nr:HalOD1 output domain-containing protein [Haloparvum sedimenti]